MGGGGKGGGGGGGAQQVTSTTSNIPEYARPYVENMLQSAQAQIYNDDMTSFRPYEAYSSDPSNYFAEFSPMQQQAQQAAYNLQTPGQFAAGSELSGQAGMGQLGTVGQAAGYGASGAAIGQQGQGLGVSGGGRYGQMGADIGQQGQQLGVSGGGRYGQLGVDIGQQGQQLGVSGGAGYGQMGAGFGTAGVGLGQQALSTAPLAGMYGESGFGFGERGVQAAEQGFGAGQRFEGMATDPRAQQSYMSPYMQNVVDVQKESALRDFQIAQQARQAGAVGRGAFGGSRAAVVDAEAQRSLMSQLQGIQATGTQKAFEDAQRQMQFGSQLGLQGLQAGYQGLQTGMQGAQTGLQGLQGVQEAYRTGLQGTAQGMQGAQIGLQGVDRQLAGTAQGMQGADLGLRGVDRQLAGTAQGMQGAQIGLQGVDRQLAGTAQGMQGAQIGLQGVAGQQAGFAGANQAAATLGQLGAQQLAAEQNIINTQSTLGGQQQAQQQQIINQAIQDYATEQQYPFMQLGMTNSLLRGLPMQSMTTQSYQATPSYLTQGLGAAGTLAGAAKAFGAKEGGVIKGLKAGGAVAKYAVGGNSSSEVVSGIRGKLAQMDEAQLQQVMKTSSSQEVREMASEVLMEKRMAMQAERQAPQVPMSEGIAALPAPSMDQMAGGGIIAFAEGDQVEDPDLKYQDMIRRQREAAGVTEPANTKFKEFLATQVGALPAMRDQAKGQMMMDYFSNFGTQTGGALSAGLKAAKEVGPQFKATADKLNKAEMDLMKGQADLEQADRLEKLGLVDKANALRDKYDEREAAYKRTMDAANVQARATMANAARATDLDRDAEAYFNLLVGEGMDAKDPKTRALARQKAREGANPYAQGKLDLQAEAAITKREEAELAPLRTRLTLADEKDKPGILAEIEAAKQKIRADITKVAAPSGTGTSAPAVPGAQKAPDISTVTGAPKGSTIGSFVQGKGFEVKDKGGNLIGYAQGK
jgi:hypothetical protein